VPSFWLPTTANSPKSDVSQSSEQLQPALMTSYDAPRVSIGSELAFRQIRTRRRTHVDPTSIDAFRHATRCAYVSHEWHQQRIALTEAPQLPCERVPMNRMIMDGTVARVTRVVRTMVDDSEIAAYMVSSRRAFPPIDHVV